MGRNGGACGRGVGGGRPRHLAAGNAPGSFVREQVVKAKSMTDQAVRRQRNAAVAVRRRSNAGTCGGKGRGRNDGRGQPGQIYSGAKAAGSKVIPVIPSVTIAKEDGKGRRGRGHRGRDRVRRPHR